MTSNGSIAHLDKNSINIIRTMQRNNIDLKHIADNKATILLSLNALMITFLIPIILNNLEIIIKEHLYIPIGFLFLTCFSTIMIAATVLKPFNWKKTSETEMNRFTSSPFFFINFYTKSIDEFIESINKTIANTEVFKEHVLADLFFIGKVLGVKYRQIGICYNVFLGGLCLSVLSSIIEILFM